jgi:predicted nucleic acid-binding protein
MKYLIDTDWVIDHLKGEERVVKQLEELASEGIAISVISLAEIYFFS